MSADLLGDSPPPFTMKDWEEIVFRSSQAWETRKREYTRWVAIGVTSSVALSGIFLERLPQVDLGKNVGLSLLLLLLLTYIIQHMGVEILEGRINSAVRVILATEEVPESPWTVLKNLFKIAELNARRILKSSILASIAVTAVIALGAASLWPAPSSTPMAILGAWRGVTILLFGAFVLNIRSSAKKLLPEKEKILAAAPRAYPPADRQRHEKVAPVLALIPLAYYAGQLGFLGWAIVAAIPLTYGMVQLVSPLVGLAVIVVWVGDVAWPLVKRSSDFFGELRDVHHRIVMGEIRTTAEVLAQLKALENEIEKVREDQQ